MTTKKKFTIASLFVLSFFLFSCTKTKSHQIKDLDGKLYMDEIVDIGTKHLYESRKSNEFGVCGGEYVAARKYHLLDINEDGLEDLLIFMIFEGTNCGNSGDVNQYLFTAIAENPYHDETGSSFKAHSFSQIGSRGYAIDSGYVAKKKNNIFFKGHKYGFQDDMCCPSKKFKIKIPISSLDKTFKGTWIES
tara:strand:+ start:623 stop:1195 length:573 start_codon:yes stop_codon:yes gene_type:complete